MYRALTGLGLLGAALLKKRSSLGFAENYVDEMVHAYLVAALWSSTDDEGEPLDKNYGISDIASGAKREAKNDVKKFVDRAGNLLDDISADSAGHDFWLTRNHHGAGFWDRGYGQKGEALTQLSHSFGEKWMYVGDRGKVYFG